MLLAETEILAVEEAGMMLASEIEMLASEIEILALEIEMLAPKAEMLALVLGAGMSQLVVLLLLLVDADNVRVRLLLVDANNVRVRLLLLDADDNVRVSCACTFIRSMISCSPRQSKGSMLPKTKALFGVFPFQFWRSLRTFGIVVCMIVIMVRVCDI